MSAIEPRIATRVAKLCVVIAALGAAVPLFSADDPKPDRRKANAAYQRGLAADKVGHRDEAIALYTEAIGDDPGFGAPLRARGRDYAAAGDTAKAEADFDKSIATRPPD